MKKSYRYDFWIGTLILVASKSYCSQKRSENFFTFLIETQNVQRKTRSTKRKFHSTDGNGSHCFKKQ
jgi:hypothetical protein